MKKTEIAKILEHTPNAVFLTSRGACTIDGFTTKGGNKYTTGATAVNATLLSRYTNDAGQRVTSSGYQLTLTLTQIESHRYDTIAEWETATDEQTDRAAKIAAQRNADIELLRDSVPVLSGLLQRHGINTHISHWNAQAEFKLSAHQIELLIQALEVGAYHSESK